MKAYCTLVVYILLLLISRCSSHSWVACTDYRGNVSGGASEYSEAKCFGYPRDWTSNTLASIGKFGLDRGFNYQPGNGPSCRDQLDGRFDYTDEFPKASYEAGGTFRILWPAKNHARVRDFGLVIYACCGIACTDRLENSVSEFASNENLISNLGRNVNGGGVGGFGNCPDQSNADNAVCFADISLDPGLRGECTFLWYWPFNSITDVYTTCWDANVGNSQVVDDTQPKIEKVTTSPVPQVSQDAPNNQRCLKEYAQCGGKDFGESRCCIAGFTCFSSNSFYSQCIPDDQAVARSGGTPGGR